MLKQDPGTPVNSGDYHKAWHVWNTFWMDELGMYPLQFHNFLGLTKGITKAKKVTGTLHIRRSAARKINLLNGPYSHTFLKVYQIRKGLFKQNSITKFTWK